MRPNLRSAVTAINKYGALLVYPIDNRKEPPSLWSVFFPRSEMRWEWDQEGDTRVSDLWHLREELSRSGRVVYAKWFRGRATFFSRTVFTQMLAFLGTPWIEPLQLSPEALGILEVLETDSPLSTKQLKRAVGLQGRHFEGIYSRALKELWLKLLIVGFGEVDEGAFPSLAMGATKNLFEDLYNEAKTIPRAKAEDALHRELTGGSPFLKFLLASHKNVTSQPLQAK